MKRFTLDQDTGFFSRGLIEANSCGKYSTILTSSASTLMKCFQSKMSLNELKNESLIIDYDDDDGNVELIDDD